MKKVISILLSVLILLSLASAFAATEQEAIALKNHLASTVGSEKIWDSVDSSFDSIMSISWDTYVSDEGVPFIFATLSSYSLDNEIKKILDESEDANKALTLMVFLNFAGKIAKQMKAYGTTDITCIMNYKTQTDNIGQELNFGIGVDLTEDKMLVFSDDIFGFSGSSLKFSESFDANYDLDLASFSD